jgi:hypothetical protein
VTRVFYHDVMTFLETAYIDGVHGAYDPFAAEDEEDEALPPILATLPSPHAGAVYLPASHMTRTEVVLRFARYLLTSHAAAGDVDVSLTGRELTRRGQPHFPVRRFLAERGCVVHNGDLDWRGRYSMKAVPHALLLGDSATGADLIAPLVIGRRLIVHGSRGPLVETRSPSEHMTLRATLGRLLTYEQYEPDDIAVALVPRSRRFRALAVQWRRARFIAAADIFIVTVDRTGSVDGFPIGQ